jgi:hypothetical protein
MDWAIIESRSMVIVLGVCLLLLKAASCILGCRLVESKHAACFYWGFPARVFWVVAVVIGVLTVANVLSGVDPMILGLLTMFFCYSHYLLVPFLPTLEKRFLKLGANRCSEQMLDGDATKATEGLTAFRSIMALSLVLDWIVFISVAVTLWLFSSLPILPLCLLLCLVYLCLEGVRGTRLA